MLRVGTQCNVPFMITSGVMIIVSHQSLSSNFCLKHEQQNNDKKRQLFFMLKCYFTSHFQRYMNI